MLWLMLVVFPVHIFKHLQTIFYLQILRRNIQARRSCANHIIHATLHLYCIYTRVYQLYNISRWYIIHRCAGNSSASTQPGDVGNVQTPPGKPVKTQELESASKKRKKAPPTEHYSPDADAAKPTRSARPATAVKAKAAPKTKTSKKKTTNLLQKKPRLWKQISHHRPVKQWLQVWTVPQPLTCQIARRPRLLLKMKSPLGLRILQILLLRHQARVRLWRRSGPRKQHMRDSWGSPGVWRVVWL